MWYPLCILIGLALAAWAGSRQPPTPGIDPALRARLAFAAVIGAILGAYLLQLPADLLGWAAPAPDGLEGTLPLGGRTVLGGLLGGWVGVEVAKRVLQVTQPTGDGFALPLAIALACGRVGCALAGCCQGVACAPTWWAIAHDGVARVPVPLIEAAFHALAALALWCAARRRWAPGRRLAIYLAVYAVLRFALEFQREHPPAFLALTWYQWLALALFALAGGTWWARSRASSRAVH